MGDRYISLFLEALVAERNASRNTVMAYRKDLELFLSYLVERNKELGGLNFLDINGYLDYLKGLGDSVSTIQRKLTVLRQFYQFLVGEEILSFDPTEKVIRPRSRRPMPKVISVEEVKNLFCVVDSFEYSDSIRIKLMLLLLYGSGLRVSELVSLKLSSFSGRFLRVYGKGSKERIVPLAPQTEEVLKEYLGVLSEDGIGKRGSRGSDGWLFGSRGGKPITRQRVFQILKDLAIRANLPKESLSPHVLRHAFATHILDNGGNLMSIKKMLGHSSIATTEIYTHVSQAKLAKIIKEKHPINKII